MPEMKPDHTIYIYRRRVGGPKGAIGSCRELKDQPDVYEVNYDPDVSISEAVRVLFHELSHVVLMMILRIPVSVRRHEQLAESIGSAARRLFVRLFLYRSKDL